MAKKSKPFAWWFYTFQCDLIVFAFKVWRADSNDSYLHLHFLETYQAFCIQFGWGENLKRCTTDVHLLIDLAQTVFRQTCLYRGRIFLTGTGYFDHGAGFTSNGFLALFSNIGYKNGPQKRRLRDNSSSLWWFEQYHVNVFQRLPCTLQSEASLDFAHRYLREQHKYHDTRVHICHPAHFDKTSVV